MGLERWVGKAAVVTGAATGFGRSITQKMIEKGIKVPRPQQFTPQIGTQKKLLFTGCRF